MINLIDVFDADIKDLISMKGARFASSDAEVYHSILLSYMNGNQTELQNEITRLESLYSTNNNKSKNINDILLKIGKLRLATRSNTITEKEFEDFSNMDSVPGNWCGEYFFALNNAALVLKKYEKAVKFSLAAAHELKIIGAKRKSVRALMNAISAESCIKPDKYYISDLLYIYRESKKAKEFSTVGTSLLNLSREYQKLALFNMALKYANRSIAVYTKYSPGGRDYALSLCHRAHLFAQMGAINEAQLDIEEALGVNFVDVQSAIGILIEKFPVLSKNSKSINNIDFANYSWKERSTEVLPKSMTKLEVKLIELLTKKPQNKNELSAALYGERIELGARVNRLYNLLNRIRKAQPGLIAFKENRYYLLLEPYVAELSEKIRSY